jgi:SAM-dependent methyltransferase
MSPTRGDSGQEAATKAKNRRFFAANQDYARRVSSLDTYRNIRAAIDPEIVGARRLLDVGNGGVFDYDTSLAQEIVAVDLFVEGTPTRSGANITFRHGDALGLEEPDSAYDRVLEISVFHHLIGTTIESTLANIRLAIDEAFRVLQPGGRLVVMESCVSSRAFTVERRLFGALRLLARTPVMSHPATLQFPADDIGGLISNRFGNVAVAPIPVGRWIVQFGVRWPSTLTPARPYLFTAIRNS